MHKWKDFANAHSALAEFGAKRIAGRVAYLATVCSDGSPRVHPVAPFFGQGHLYVYMDPTSPKCKDLQRDPRYALHCSVENTNGGEGEFYIRGQARVVADTAKRATVFQIAREVGFNPKDRYIVFELDIQRAASLVYHGDQILRDAWRASEDKDGV